MSEPVRPLKSHVEPRLTEARLARQWWTVSSRLRAGRSGSGRTEAGALARAGTPSLRLWGPALAAALLGLGWWGWSAWGESSAGWRTPRAVAGSVIESTREATEVALHDGSRIELAPRTRVAMREDGVRRARIEVQAGTARFEVRPQRGREFVVAAAQIEVVVVGTRFSVARERVEEGMRVRVQVEEGRVRVRRNDGQSGDVRLSAGARWSVLVPDRTVPDRTVPDRTVPDRTVPDRTVPDPHRVDAPTPSRQEDDASRVRADARGEEVRAPRPASPAPDAMDSSPRPAPGSQQAVKERASALLEQASAARRAGALSESAALYERLQQRFPGDARAGLAAFELARLRMDALGDLQGAARALRRAIDLAPAGSFREDAMARLVQVYDALGASEACRKAREAYFARYRQGVHRAVLLDRCASR